MNEDVFIDFWNDRCGGGPKKIRISILGREIQSCAREGNAVELITSNQSGMTVFYYSLVCAH